MARTFRRHRAQHPIADLNVTNLIDLGFLLLVIFMITAQFVNQEQRVPVNLPVEAARPQPAPDEKERREAITVRADGRVLLGDQVYSVKQLTTELAKFAAEPKPPVIELRLDAKATTQQWIDIMAELQKHGLTKISFPTQVAR